MINVVWTDYAEKSLKKSIEFLDEQWGEEVVDGLISLLDNRINQLRKNPYLAPNIADTKFKRLIIHKFISLFYTVKKDTIKIVLIWDNRQSPDDLVKFLMNN